MPRDHTRCYYVENAGKNTVDETESGVYANHRKPQTGKQIHIKQELTQDNTPHRLSRRQITGKLTRINKYVCYNKSCNRQTWKHADHKAGMNISSKFSIENNIHSASCYGWVHILKSRFCFYALVLRPRWHLEMNLASINHFCFRCHLQNYIASVAALH